MNFHDDDDDDDDENRAKMDPLGTKNTQNRDLGGGLGIQNAQN